MFHLFTPSKVVRHQLYQKVYLDLETTIQSKNYKSMVITVKSINVVLDYHHTCSFYLKINKKYSIFDCWFFLVTPSKMPYISIEN